MPIHSEERQCLDGVIGVITLDAPATMNALSEQMIDAMQAQLDQWEDDDRICLILIQGAGEKAFCAGGDIRQLYQALNGPEAERTAARFFGKEYHLDYTLHRFPKPVIGWARRVVMGGGMGILAACRYRLVTPDLIMAMPEVGIGLFPDVGASWFLNRLPEGLGLFLGLTGARLNATDALRIGLADIAVYANQQETLLETLQSQRWSGEVATDDNRLFRLLNRLSSPPHETLPPSQLMQHEQTISRLCGEGDLIAMVDRLQAEAVNSEWWRTCMQFLAGGNPVSAWLLHEQLKRGRQMSMKDIFRMELVMATRCAGQPDLAEGIRARLIDRDQAPKWSYQHIREVSREHVELYFVPPWSEENDPLANL
ncbi:MAG: enoyl-CoA hydratase/isomerase family protein [Marinobacter sp.]|uniref:enoyl-CoA hydratase/isomerase family protein n=1 Tax=Marinobacter sp. TaxID=50741 RepID=UPI0034A02FD9